MIDCDALNGCVWELKDVYLIIAAAAWRYELKLASRIVC